MLREAKRARQDRHVLAPAPSAGAATATLSSGMIFLCVIIPLEVVVLRVILSENRFPPRIKSGAGFFGITRQRPGPPHAAFDHRRRDQAVLRGDGGRNSSRIRARVRRGSSLLR